MNMPSWMNGPPKRILLATDLSPRCDRALDRVVLLADQWQAKLVIVHVLEEPEPNMTDPTGRLPSWRRPSDPLSVARKQLHTDVGPVAGHATVVIETGDPVDAIIRTAENEDCGLIVTGLARDEILGRFLLGRTVDRLLRRSQVPLLVVKNRARAPYRHVVVATDFSNPSRHALEAAAHMFPYQRLTVFNAYEAPLSGRMIDSAPYQRQYRTAVEQECDAFLQTMKKPDQWQSPNVLIEHGAPWELLREYVQEKAVDLVVLGTQGRSAVMEVLLGSVAKMIVDEVHCDALVIRAPPAATEI
ncbi:universal stress protein [Bradyrhizobium sp. CCBAU 51765]|uniref:universal stress protein n=1 Tax=Bradyrhizobium sp. CCBAU 51765 TaxID=1325102 RepID=UPI0018875C1A|nr:universal stress protein [Bradyrhizobium sp. CCBAU 51765]QOZ06701.1 universal stress protein [Bradyrhizobium sp. CCBAU 51765]